ncbi:MAG: surface lipoprotein assembly modifier [Paracoccaceae bacterium]
MKRAVWAVLALWALAMPAQIHAQAVSAEQAAAEQALVAGQPAEALAISEAILAETPDNFAALFLKAAALIDLNDPVQAARVAGDAYAVAETRIDRLQAARLAGRARFLAGQYARSEWWFRRASNNVATPEEEREVINAFRTVRRANPLTFQVGFGAAPTNNFNNGAKDGSVLFEGLGTFELPPDQRPLSGIEINGDMRLEYRIAASTRQNTRVGLYLYARTYAPSDEARDSVPGIDGNDYSLGIVDAFVQQDRLVFPSLGVSQISIHNGRLFYGGQHYWDYVRVGLSQDIRVSDRMVMNLAVSQENQFGVPLRHEDTGITTLALGLDRVRENGDRIGFKVSKKLYDTEAFEASYEDYKFEVSYQLGRPVMGVSLAGKIGVGHTNYDAFFLSLDGRRDDYVFGTASAVWRDLSYFGFSPRADITFEKRASDVSQYARTTAAVRLGVTSSF